MNIPDFVFSIFFSRFNKQPSIIEVEPPFESDLYNKIFSKEEIWFLKRIDGEGKSVSEIKLIEYDATGVLIFKNSENKIFILTTPEKKNVAEFTIYNLKKNVN